MNGMSDLSGMVILDRMPILAILASTVLGLQAAPAGSSASDPLERGRPWWRTIETRPLFPEELSEDGLPRGWKVVGGPAQYRFEAGPDGDRILHGSGNSPRNAFLVDPRVTGDFLLEFEVLIDRDGGNSGVQVRSAVDGGRMVGYQIEIDPSPRSWSGGLYDEGRRGWLASLADNADARSAFVPGRWNRYTVLAIGPRIRTWINDVPAIDHVDFIDPAGRIGLQVHGGRCEVRWRKLRIADLGMRSLATWSPDTGKLSVGGAAMPVVVPTDGLDVSVEPAIPDAPTTIRIETTLKRGTLHVELRKPGSDSGYTLAVPSPLGVGKGGVIRLVRDVDAIRAFIDDVPMVPGPPDLEGPLRLAIRADAGTDAVIRRIDVTGPSETESRVIEEWRSRDVDPGR